VKPRLASDVQLAFSQKRSQCILDRLEGQNIWSQASNMWKSRSNEVFTIKINFSDDQKWNISWDLRD
jgi:hypothetical protein